MEYLIRHATVPLGQPTADWDSALWQSADTLNIAHYRWEDSGHHPRTQARMTWMLDNIETNIVWRIECEGANLLERLLYTAHVTDWISIALALVKGVDPSDMAAIDSLKAHLATVQ